jgi:hypothetical protein
MTNPTPHETRAALLESLDEIQRIRLEAREALRLEVELHRERFTDYFPVEARCNTGISPPPEGHRFELSS